MDDKHIAGTILMVVLMLLLLPLQWLCAALLAALIHELGHFLMVIYLGGTVDRVRIGPIGATMEASGLTVKNELICLLAGPAAGVLTLLLVNKYPIVALCGFVQTIYNLLPIYPLDGGKIVYILVSMLGGSDKTIHIIECLAFMILLFLCIIIKVCYGISLFLFVVVLLFRKTPCKHEKDWI